MEPKYLFIFMATVYFSVAEAQLEEFTQMFQKPNISKKVYCGRQLSSILSTVCQGRYNTLIKKTYTHTFQKKSLRDSMHNAGEKQMEREEELSYPYKSRASATTLMTQFRRRRKRGVYNECCEKACSHDELLSYCAPPNEKSSSRR